MALKRVTPGLKTKTLTTGKQRLYSDLDLSFAAKPGSEDADGVFKGDVYKKGDVAAVIQSVQNILLTNTGEKPFEPTFGANLRQLLFDQTSAYSELFISDIIKLSLLKWEPRARVVSVKYYAGNDLLKSGISDFRSHVNNTVRIDVELLINNEGRVATVNMNRLR
jgi:phage baseplate assembly protein W